MKKLALAGSLLLAANAALAADLSVSINLNCPLSCDASIGSPLDGAAGNIDLSPLPWVVNYYTAPPISWDYFDNGGYEASFGPGGLISITGPLGHTFVGTILDGWSIGGDIEPTAVSFVDFLGKWDNGYTAGGDAEVYNLDGSYVVATLDVNTATPEPSGFALFTAGAFALLRRRKNEG